MKVTRNLGLRPFHPACGGSRLQRHGFISVIFISAVALSLSVNLSKSVLADAAAEATVEAPRDEVAPSSLPEAASPGSGDGSVKRESADESDSQKIEPSVTPPELGAAEPSAVREKHVTRTKDVSEASPANSGKPREGSQEASEKSLREDKPMAEEEKCAERENITGQQSGPHADAARQKRSINDSGTPKLESPLQTGERGEALGQERPAEDEGERQKQSASEEPRAPAPEASGAASETPAGAGSVDSKTDEKQQIVVEEVTQAGGRKARRL
ncbi:hypothetical protein BESB_082210 [Besnoitia besnoiti]|uniref:Uncharacterized protein n=1 Tax=Besnoitia besnoiti TaxID=94643 RepID=A0A2A9MCA6_BESBE|nr:hypothetical protein BESB_082210 [Besnoitia besnoiti]PFH33022.1 hypothetical protein BESB_082210 [Besnoitia besnoiti]